MDGKTSDKAIVTLIIGDTVRNLWTSYMEGSWRHYAANWGYDIVVIDDFIDKSPLAHTRTPHWQKLLTLQHPRVTGYKHAVWVDADICINHFRAPCIVGQMQSDKVGCVVTFRGEEAETLYRAYGTLPQTDQLTNTGVLVMQPARHAEMLDWVYRNYKENDKSAKENIPLSHHLFANNLAEPIDRRYNVDWTQEILDKYPFLTNIHNPDRDLLAAYCIHAAWGNSYFLHFINQEFEYSNNVRSYNTRSDIRLLHQERLDPQNILVRRTQPAHA